MKSSLWLNGGQAHKSVTGVILQNDPISHFIMINPTSPTTTITAKILSFKIRNIMVD